MRSPITSLHKRLLNLQNILPSAIAERKKVIDKTFIGWLFILGIGFPIIFIFLGELA